MDNSPWGLEGRLRNLRTEAEAFLILLMLALGLSWPCAAQTDTDIETVVGKAGDVFISEREFVQRFEMLPGLYRHRSPHLEGSKLELLYSIIAEKLLAQEALARNLDQDSSVQDALGELKSVLARDELYRQEVRSKVKVTDAEIARGIAQAKVQLLLAYIFCEREEDARFLRAQIGSGREFDRLQIDSSMGALRDTATVIWGDAEQKIEEAAYTLKRGEVSQVVHASKGFYILKRLRAYPSSGYRSMSPDVLHERVIEKIRLRKETVRASDFVDEVLEDKVGRSLPEPFKLLARSMEEVFKNHARDSLIWFTTDLAPELKSLIDRSLGDTLVLVGDARWTIDQVIDRLLHKRISVAATEIHTIPPRLNSEIKLMVQQELLGKEALRRGLDNSPAVRSQLEMWHTSYLADIMKEYVHNHMKVSEAEVFSYLKTKDPKSLVPLVQIRELRTSSLADMSEAFSDLERGMSFERVIEKWSNDSVAITKKGISDFFPITERPPIGQIASEMEIGQRYGPVHIAKGELYFELLAKRQVTPADSTSEARVNTAKAELLQMKQKRMVSLLLAQIAQQKGFTVYEDRLSKIEVTPIPMMTFRLLGFGGRMPAVPFVQKELDWLDVEPPKEKILP